jgi:TetR/AcrR family transcriptional regulator, regulator of autoinduction and epiphytic fitness
MSVTDAGPRSARAERTRVLIADALLSLLDEGDLQPTATRIADRAGISLRLIYHHFGDLEALFREASERETVRLLARVQPVPLDLPFEGRLEAFVDQRASLLEWMTPVLRASALHAPTSEALQAAGRRANRAADRELERVFAPEIGRLSAARRGPTVDALFVLCSWPAWNGLRVRGRSVAASREAMSHALAGLLAAHP